MRGLDETDRLEAARHGHGDAVDDDPLGGDGDRLEAGGAEPVHRHRAHGHGQAGPESGLAGDVVPGGPFRHRAAYDDVLHLARVHAGPLDGVLDDVAGEGGAVRQVERAAVRLADRGPGGRDDHRVCHGSPPVFV